MAHEWTPRDDERPAADAPGRSSGIARVFGHAVSVLTALARGADAASGAGPGVLDHDAGHRTDAAAQRRRDYRP